MFSFFRASLVVILSLGYATQVWGNTPADKARVKVEIRRAEIEPADGLSEATVAGTNDKVYLHKSAEITNEDIAEVRAAVDGKQKPVVEIVFTKEGAKKMAKLSEQHQKKHLAIMVDGKVISAPTMRARISERALIAGNFSKEDVEKLVKEFNGK
jgi:preprotein translocase subunit SecD